MDKLRELGLDKNSLVFYTTDNGAWQDVYRMPVTPLPRYQAPCVKVVTRCRPSPGCPARSKAGVRNSDILGGLDLMATFASVAGIDLPTKDRKASLLF
ncbi:MAG: hypothetical protein H6988_01645 [Pseudomonadales bacterium]|nr:hypothetical protein [Pseudomonadales bacterium]